MHAQFNAVGRALYLHQIKHGARSAFDVSFIFQILQHVKKTAALFEMVLNCQTIKIIVKQTHIQFLKRFLIWHIKKELCKMHLFLDVIISEYFCIFCTVS